jgi:hemerythrin-like domain-containing protein
MDAPQEGLLERWVQEEQSKLGDVYAEFRKAWDERDTVTALYAFEGFRKNMNRHMKWEEESLFEEYEKRASIAELHAVRRHHMLHESADSIAIGVLKLLARRLTLGPEVDLQIADRLASLESLLARHRDVEMYEICAPLDESLGGGELDEIHEELVERGAVPPFAPVCR